MDIDLKVSDFRKAKHSLTIWSLLGLYTVSSSCKQTHLRPHREIENDLTIDLHSNR